MDETRLLAAMKSIRFINSEKDAMLTDEEKMRNSFGDSWVFTYDPKHPKTYPSTIPGSFPDILNCVCKTDVFGLPKLGPDGLYKGLCKGVSMGVEAISGFPSLKSIPHHAALGYHGVNIFNSESQYCIY